MGAFQVETCIWTYFGDIMKLFRGQVVEAGIFQLITVRNQQSGYGRNLRVVPSFYLYTFQGAAVLLDITNFVFNQKHPISNHCFQGGTEFLPEARRYITPRG